MRSLFISMFDGRTENTNKKNVEFFFSTNAIPFSLSILWLEFSRRKVAHPEIEAGPGGRLGTQTPLQTWNHILNLIQARLSYGNSLPHVSASPSVKWG